MWPRRLAARLRDRLPSLRPPGSARRLAARVRAAAAPYLRLLFTPVRLGQFASVGLVGALCETVVLAALVEGGVLGPVVGSPLSKEASIVVMFVLNEHWTFAEAGAAGADNLFRRFLRSNVVRAGGAVTGWVVLVALYEGVGVWYLLANAIGIGFGFTVNYVAENLVTWRIHRS